MYEKNRMHAKEVLLKLLFFTLTINFFSETLADSKIMRTFAPVIEKGSLTTPVRRPVRLSVRTQDFHS